MYRLYRVNRFGQLVTSKGLGTYPIDKGGYTLSFSSLERAKKYGKAFVNRYPSLYCEIYTDNDNQDPIVVIENIDYQTTTLKSKIKFKRNNNNKKYLELFAMNIFAITIFLVSYIVFSFGINFFIAFPILIIVVYIVWSVNKIRDAHHMKDMAEKYDFLY